MEISKEELVKQLIKHSPEYRIGRVNYEVKTNCLKNKVVVIYPSKPPKYFFTGGDLIKSLSASNFYVDIEWNKHLERVEIQVEINGSKDEFKKKAENKEVPEKEIESELEPAAF